MAEKNRDDQEQRRGGYGDDTGGADAASAAPEKGSTGATGRENPVTDAADADEALGNRTGGYGGNPPAEP